MQKKEVSLLEFARQLGSVQLQPYQIRAMEGVKILELVVTGEWFWKIVSGEKPEEYRKVTPYWMARLMEKPVDLDTFMEFRRFDYVRFRLGYAKDAPEAWLEWKGTEIGEQNPAWSNGDTEPCFVIKLEQMVFLRNRPQ